MFLPNLWHEVVCHVGEFLVSIVGYLVLPKSGEAQVMSKLSVWDARAA
jgi:hypothetical protein